MTLRFIAVMVLCAMTLLPVTQTRAQDHSQMHHSQHQAAPESHPESHKDVFKVADPAKPSCCPDKAVAEHNCPCCKDGECPMIKEGKPCPCCKNGECPMMKEHHAMSTPQATGDAAIDELNAAMARMHANMAISPTGDPDADFVRGMIPHHQGAIDMAEIVLKHGDDPQTRQLARTIIRAQKGEIALMRKWLKLRQIPEKDSIDLNR